MSNAHWEPRGRIDERNCNQAGFLMRPSLVYSFLLSLLATSAGSETSICANTSVSVTSRQSASTEMVCDAVKQTEMLFDQCDLPPVTRPLSIDIVSELKAGCVALYHCGEDWIEVLEPDLMEERRNPEGAFAFLDIDTYFHSVVVHELTHTNFDDAPCPFETCVVADEYIAFSMQVMSLTLEQQAEFESGLQPERQISRDELSAIILFMAPSLFARKSWIHLSQRYDQCGYLRKILDGTILLDYERF